MTLFDSTFPHFPRVGFLSWCSQGEKRGVPAGGDDAFPCHFLVLQWKAVNVVCGTAVRTGDFIRPS